MTVTGVGRGVAVCVLGILFPIMLLTQAYLAMSKLQTFVMAPTVASDTLKNISQLKQMGATANDYALFAMTAAEESNKRVIINKQLMKITIMQVGFAVASVALMFIVLGVKAGGGSGKVKWMDVEIDLRTTSTGLVALIVGAGMVTAGGVIRNDYNTVPAPNFIPIASPAASAKEIQALWAYRECKRVYPDTVNQCFGKLFPAIYAQEINANGS